MKIALVSEHASPLAEVGGVDAGGQNHHVAELAAALAALNNDVTVYTRRDSRDLPNQVQADGGYLVEQVPAGPPERIPKDSLLAHVPAFARYLRGRWSTDRPDVVHAHFWMSGVAALAATRGLEIPVAQTFHALGVVKRRFQQGKDTSPVGRIRMEQAIARSAAHTIATCTDEVFELLRMGVPRRRVTVVPCGVNLQHFRPRETARFADGRPRLVSIGRLVERKGFDVLIRAARRVPEAEVIIAGGPPAAELHTDPEARRLRALAESLRIADRVTLLGRVSRDDMPALLRSATAVVCTPRYEPFGMVPLEAMACGVPVIATAVGGLTDTVVDGVTGVLVPPDRPDRLAHAINRLLADPLQCDAYGIAGADRASSRYSWTRVAADTLRIYENLLAGRGFATGPIAEVSW